MEGDSGRGELAISAVSEKIKSKFVQADEKLVCYWSSGVEKLIKIKELRIKCLQDLIEIETFDKDITDEAQLEALIKEKAQAELEFAVRMGELKVLFPCPIQCCTHKSSNGPNSFRHKQKRPAESPILPATLILDKKQEKSNIVKKKSKKGSTPKTETNNKNPAKKTKQDFDQSWDDVIPTKNAFAGLVIDEPEIVVLDKTAQVADLSPKIKPVMLSYKKIYNLVLQELNKNFPESVNKLTGDYIKIQASNIEEPRAITALLKQKGEEFYFIPSPADRPLKAVIKGLHSSTSIEDIKTDLTEQGVPVIKVAQLTQRKSKFTLPIFIVKVRKNAEAAMDKYDVSKCCYMSIVIDPFKNRPAATQCYNCNYFNHSSENCEMKPRCLKCSRDHRTGDFSIKERIENPNTLTAKRKVIPGLTFASVTNSDQQRTAPVDKTKPAKKKSKPITVIIQEGKTTSGFKSAMSEFRKLFQSFPGLIEEGKALKNAKSPQEKLDIYFRVMASAAKPHTSQGFITNTGLDLRHGTRTVSDHILLN
ncbi:nucleic-acid-binding protein from transposon X-element [Trichonephila clavipes]|nr:nucleic-acid-binding protein from transposon X-element [Trichonephila clavipes]